MWWHYPAYRHWRGRAAKGMHRKQLAMVDLMYNLGGTHSSSSEGVAISHRSSYTMPVRVCGGSTWAHARLLSN